jgi:hypothetical protein
VVPTYKLAPTTSGRPSIYVNGIQALFLFIPSITHIWDMMNIISAVIPQENILSLTNSGLLQLGVGP